MSECNEDQTANEASIEEGPCLFETKYCTGLKVSRHRKKTVRCEYKIFWPHGDLCQYREVG